MSAANTQVVEDEFAGISIGIDFETAWRAKQTVIAAIAKHERVTYDQVSAALAAGIPEVVSAYEHGLATLVEMMLDVRTDWTAPSPPDSSSMPASLSPAQGAGVPC